MTRNDILCVDLFDEEETFQKKKITREDFLQDITRVLKDNITCRVVSCL